MLEINITIKHPEGLHARPAAKFVKTAQQFQSNITISMGRWKANAKSILEILTIGVNQGDEVRISADGQDAKQAVEAIREQIEINFGDELDEFKKPGKQEGYIRSKNVMKMHDVSASFGIAIGPIYIFEPVQIKPDSHKCDNVSLELSRLDEAITKAEIKLRALEESAKNRDSAQEAAIFEAHALMLADPSLRHASQSAINEKHLRAETAIFQAGEEFAQKVEKLPGELIRQRAIDIRDVVNRVIRILTGASDSAFDSLTSPSVIFADDLTPSDTIQLDKTLALGICTRQGSRTSHAAILARNLGIPAVMGGEFDIDELQNGMIAILDGENGSIHIQPDEETLTNYQAKLQIQKKQQADNLLLATEPAQTQDGIQVEIAANIGGLRDAQIAVSYGAEAVGLLRTEFLFLERSDIPDEHEQYAVYRSILETLSPRPVILRTLDIGGDKRLPYFCLPEEMNPFLGLRAVRLCFQHPELWMPQLRAALRAGHGHQLRLMFPMIANLYELHRAKEVVEECKAALQKEGQPFAENIEIGIMIEIPSAALMANILAPEVDFFSIGTNDLSQYTFAADRMNPSVAEIANPLDPALLQLVKHTIDGAHSHGKWVGMCGELAGEPLAIPILLGMGLDEFSMNPRQIPEAKVLIRQLAVKDCKKLARDALQMEGAEKVEILAQNFIQERIDHEENHKENADLLLSQVILPQAVDFELDGFTRKEEVIEHLADRLEQAGALSSAREFIAAVYEREKQGPTYINHHVAFPHGKDQSVLQAAVAFGRSQSGIQYDNDFGSGVARLIFLIAIPEEMQATAYIDVLKRLARLLMQESFREEALQLDSYEALIAAVERGEVLVQD